MHLKSNEMEMLNENPSHEQDDRDAYEVQSDKEIGEALRNIHQQYGNDFEAFIRDVQESLRKKRAESHSMDSCLM